MHLGFFPNTPSRDCPLAVLLTSLFLVSTCGCAVTPGRATVQAVHTATVAQGQRPLVSSDAMSRSIASHQPVGPQTAAPPRVHHQRRVPQPNESLAGTPLPLAGDPVVQAPPLRSPHRPAPTPTSGNTQPRDTQGEQVRLVSSEETSPSKSAGGPSRDRPRVNRLLERARHNLELGFEEEALRLAQIAERLEFSERVRFAAGEETPSQFIDRVWGERRPPLPDFPAANALAQTRRAARLASIAVAGKTPPLPASPPQPSNAAEPVSTLRPESPPLTAVANPDEIEIPQLTDEEFEELAANAKRFDRSPHRRKSPAGAGSGQRTAVTQTPPLPTDDPSEDEALTASLPVPAESLAESPTEIEPAPAVDPVTVSDDNWPVQVSADDTPAPATPLYWNWHRVCLTGFVTGLASLLVLWIWRELERWHYRVTRPV
jgi:hypothetical protein